MYERFKLVVVKLVCVDVNSTDFTKYSFKKNYLAIKDLEDEDQPYGIITDSRLSDICKILIEIAESNRRNAPTTGLCGCENYEYCDNIAWESEDEYKFKEVK